nr:hypothetical protein [Tanacetum cinerariifolium]
MVSSSSSSSSSSSAAPRWVYDKGKTVSFELENTIEESKVAVVVFSKNYANSSWCLDELTKIIECQNLTRPRVLPVFYDVEPSDVRGQKGSFETFKKYEVELISDEDKVERGGIPLNLILKKTSSWPHNKGDAVVNDVRKVVAGGRPFAAVVKGSNRPNIDGKYKARRKVSMNETATVWEVEETNFESPLRGANMEDGRMQATINTGDSHKDNVQYDGETSTLMELNKLVANVNVNDGCFGEAWSPKPDATRTMESNNAHGSFMADVSPPAAVVESINISQAGSTQHLSQVGSKQAKLQRDQPIEATNRVNSTQATPGSFDDIINSERSSRKLNLRTLVNDERMESYDFVLPKSAVDSVKNRKMIRNSPIILNKWPPSSNLKKDVVTKVPVWVKLHKVSLLAYSEDGLSLIATQISMPIMLDAFTSSMCVESRGRLNFAHALVGISSDIDLKKKVIMAIPNEDGISYTREVISVKYEWQPSSDGFTKVTRKKNKGKKANQQSRSRHIDDVGNECGASSSMGNQE